MKKQDLLLIILAVAPAILNINQGISVLGQELAWTWQPTGYAIGVIVGLILNPVLTDMLDSIKNRKNHE